jgi:WD40-like Beta Propeller Repeat
MPQRYKESTIIFSSNRGTKGGTLDIYQATVELYADPGRPKLRANTTPQLYEPGALSPSNERGPIVVPPPTVASDDNFYAGWYFASDREGGQGRFDLYRGRGGVATPIEGINSPADDFYLTLPFAKYQALFASNRAGNYDLYSASWVSMKTFPDGASNIAALESLNSDADDTAPYVDQNQSGVPSTDLVFVSNRTGGAGNYDIYCSRFVDGNWTSPLRLSDQINSPFDEFRPSLTGTGSSRILMFSSNRPGGEGGYDIYTVRYPGCQ